MDEIAFFRLNYDNSNRLLYCILMLSVLLLIKIRDQRLFFSITRIGHTDVSYNKKIDAPSENIRIQDVMAFVFRGLAFGYFAFTLLAHFDLIDASTTSTYVVICMWLCYILIKFILEMMIGLIWRSRLLFVEVIKRRSLLKAKSVFLLFIFILFSQFPTFDNEIYWAITGGVYLLYYVIAYIFFAIPYKQLIRKKILLFISYICTLEIGLPWVLFELFKIQNFL